MQELTAVLASLVALVGFVRWLLSVYFKKQTELEAQKFRNTKLAIDLLKQEVETLHLQVGISMDKIARSQISIDHTCKELKENKEGLKKLIEHLKSFIDSTSLKLRAIENTLKEANIKKVSEDIYIITPAKKNQ